MTAKALPAALIGLVLMFFVLIFVAVLTVGAMAWGYLWWKTHDLRKLNAQPSLGRRGD